MSDDAPNALGLEFSQPVPEEDSSVAAPASPVSTTAEARKEKKPYVNPDRVRTGGTQREKLSEEALAEKMARIREQNARIKERRIHVQQDEAAFRKYEEEDRQRREEVKKFQEEINSTRESNAKLKMDQVGNREWDSIKQAEGDGFSDGGGRRGGRDRWSKNESDGTGEHAVPDWANEPTEGVNNWGDAPVGGDISQWHPAESTDTEKAPDDNDENKDAGEPLLNWAGEPISSVADWSVPSGDSNEPEKDWAGNIVGLGQDWTVPTSEEPESRRNGGGRGGGRGRGRGRGDGERRGRGRGEGRGRARGSGGRGRGRSEGGEDVKIENDERQNDAGVTTLNWANDPVPAIVGWDVPTADEPVTEENNEGAQLNWAGDPVPSMADWNVPSSDTNEPETNWAGDIVGLGQDWGTSLQSSEDQTDSGWKTDRGRGRGRGRGEGGRGRGDVRGRGRGDYDRGRGRDSERGRGRGEGRGRWRGEGSRGRGEGRGGRGRGEGGSS